MRNPNGWGSITKLSGKRRKPFMVKKTTGWDDRGYPTYMIIGYYAKRSDAMQALAEFNRDPYDVDASKITFSEIYEAWSKDEFPKLNIGMEKAYKQAYNHCSSVYDSAYKSLRKEQMQACIDNSGRGHSTKANIKMLFSRLDEYAYDHDIISKCYSANLDVGENTGSDKHTIFTDDEVLSLWKLRGKPYIDETLFMLYTGCRVSEMLKMECENVNLEDSYMTGGVKTSNGKNRIIPIHPDIKPIIEEYLSDKKYLFYHSEKQDTLNYTNRYVTMWKNAMKKYGYTHLTHDCRHTVRSKLDSTDANRVAIDRIMGHSSKTIGEKVYTHKSIEELKEAMNKLSYGSVS